MEYNPKATKKYENMLLKDLSPIKLKLFSVIFMLNHINALINHAKIYMTLLAPKKLLEVLFQLLSTLPRFLFTALFGHFKTFSFYLFAYLLPISFCLLLLPYKLQRTAFHRLNWKQDRLTNSISPHPIRPLPYPRFLTISAA